MTHRWNWKTWLATFSSLALAFGPASVYANPTGANIIHGDVTINTDTPNTTVIQQSSDKSIINWQSFSIDENETTRFEQPSSSSVSLNRVTGGDVSHILGQLQSNGTILLLNPNGIIFGQNSRVDVNGIVATTSEIQNDDFLVDNLNFGRAGFALNEASVENYGTITAAENGLVALVAPRVNNDGTITARLGRVTLAAGEKYTVDLYGDQLVSLSVEDGQLSQALAENSGNIEAAGGRVAITANQAANTLDNIVNMTGYIQANTVDTQNGRIVLSSGNGRTNVNGTLIAEGAETNQSGGVVDILGQRIGVYENTNISVDGSTQAGDIHIGGNYQGQGPLPNAQRTLVTAGAQISADTTDNGNGGNVIVWADEITGFAANITARGGANGGDGGFVEVSGKESLVFNGGVDTSAAQGQQGMLLLDPTDIVILDGAGPGADDAEVSDGSILEADGGAVTFNIAEQTLEGLSAATDITLQATNDITLNDLTDNTLSLATQGNVIIQADNDGDGSGSFSMDAGDTIITDGANLIISGETVTIGAIDTSSSLNGNVTIAGNSGVTLNDTITTNDGNLILNGDTTLAADSGFNASGGNGTLILSNDMTGDFAFTIDAGSSGNLNMKGFDIDTLTITAANQISLDGTIETDAAISFANAAAINLLGDTTIRSDDGGTKGKHYIW